MTLFARTSLEKRDFQRCFTKILWRGARSADASTDGKGISLAGNLALFGESRRSGIGRFKDLTSLAGGFCGSPDKGSVRCTFPPASAPRFHPVVQRAGLLRSGPAGLRPAGAVFQAQLNH